MKTIEMFSLVALSCMSVLVAQGAPGGDKSSGCAHIRIVDTTGAPVEGAVVTVKHDRTQFAHPVTDADGRIAVNFGDGTGKPWGCTIKGVKKAGYDCRELEFRMMNLEFYAWSNDNPYENPSVIVVRKREPDPEAIRKTRQVCRFRAGTDKGCEPHSLSIFDFCHSPDESGYADLFVQPRCDRAKKEWVLSFWTTNVNSGVIATTNRVYVAPGEGYRQRVEVAQSDFLSPTFTLYLKTRPQGLYAMLPFDKYDIEADYCRALTNLKFRCSVMQVNPYGGRNLEEDVRYWHDDYGAMFVAKGTDIFDVLKEGKIPPRLDIPARVANRRKYDACDWKVIARNQVDYEMRNKEAKIRKQMENRPKAEIDKALEPIEREWQQSRKIYWELADEKRKLDEELPTLNLPPGMAEKDKYGKVDLELSFRD